VTGKPASPLPAETTTKRVPRKPPLEEQVSKKKRKKMSMLKVVTIRFLMPSVVGGRRIAEAGIAGFTRAEVLPDRHLFLKKKTQGSMLKAVTRNAVPSASAE
jgi:hypothetical protein